MPEHAIQYFPVDFVESAAGIARILERQVGRATARDEDAMNEQLPDPAEAGADDIHRADQLGPPSPFTCPECGGTLWEQNEAGLAQFRCHVGHRYAPDSLLAAHDESVGQALWTALRALEESAELHHRMARRAREHGHTQLAGTYQTRADENEVRARVIRKVLMPDAYHEPAQVADASSRATE
jgi:two-component system chemotaxis response regulator CheB